MAVSPVGVFFIVFVVLLVIAGISWVVFTQLRARRLGLPAPRLSSYIPFVRTSPRTSFGPRPSGGGIQGWISDRFRSIKNPRSAAGAYEPSAPAGRRGFGPLDPDEAWDARVGHESYGVGAYHPDDHELEDHGHHNGMGSSYMASAYQMNLAGDGTDDDRGRNSNLRSSNINLSASTAYAGAQHNPFDDAAAEPSDMSMRGPSPRFNVDTHRTPTGGSGGPTHDSPSSGAERRSVFREDV